MAPTVVGTINALNGIQFYFALEEVNDSPHYQVERYGLHA